MWLSTKVKQQRKGSAELFLYNFKHKIDNTLIFLSLLQVECLLNVEKIERRAKRETRQNEGEGEGRAGPRAGHWRRV